MVFDAGVAGDGRPYFVMEYVPGEPFTEFCRSCTLTIDGRVALFLQVCDAVQHAHQRGVLHRDLKPSNILVSAQDGRPVAEIIDFGVAKAIGPRLSDASSPREVGMLVGTPEYMSPEQAQLTDTLVDTRTDVYSWGSCSTSCSWAQRRTTHASWSARICSKSCTSSARSTRRG